MSATAGGVAHGVASGQRSALARLLTWIEEGDPRGHEASSELAAPRDAAFVLGITGPPGAGKSTLTNGLIADARAQGLTVGVLAVDPTSPFTGGALLGDRIRMTDHTHDDGVYVRSMASRGTLGGLAVAVPSALRAMECFGLERLIVETVGVGQAETDIGGQADTIVVVVAPGWGDQVQASKAGLLEIADVLVVNKADRPGAREAAADLESALGLAPAQTWHPPVVSCSALTGDGLADVAAAIRAHEAHGQSSAGVAQARQRRLQGLRTAIRELAAERAERALEAGESAELVAAVCEGRADPAAAARRLLGADGGRAATL